MTYPDLDGYSKNKAQPIENVSKTFETNESTITSFIGDDFDNENVEEIRKKHNEYYLKTKDLKHQKYDNSPLQTPLSMKRERRCGGV